MRTSDSNINSSKDATDLKLKIANERKLLRTIIDNIPVCVYTKDTHFRKTLVNSHELKQFGWQSEDEVLGKTDKELYGESVGANTQIEDEKVMFGGESILDEEKYIGNGIWAMISKLPLKNDLDETTGLVGISVNITDRVKHEKELTESYERLNEMSAQSGSFAWEINAEGVYTFISPIVETVLGYKPEDLLQKKYFYDILAITDRELIKSDAFTIMHDRRTINNYEKRALKADGTELWLSTNCRPLFNSKNEFIGYRGIDTDITQQKEMLDNLERARKIAEKSAKAKELFLTNMSHEIRTPLNVIIGMIREIGKETLSDSQRTYLKHTEASAYHLLSIINNVLDMSKIEAGEFSLDIKDFSLSAVLSNVRSILSSRAVGKKIKFTVQSDENIAKALKGDSLRLSQVLINFLGNSIKFTDEGFVNLDVQLITSNNEIQRIRFVISDSGIGMSEDFLQQIFSKFTQENDGANRSYEGTGLGMSISKEIIEMMGGDIQVESKKGKGTQISVEVDFPLGIEDQLIRIDKSTRHYDISNTRILIVEDNEMNRFIARQSLKQAKCNITEAENGQVALDILEKEKFDVILMDVQMPVMDGVEATKFIRGEMQNTTPIIALTANAFKHDIELYLSIGMNDFLIKPYKEEELFSKIESFCRTKKAVSNSFKNNENEPQSTMDLSLSNVKLFNLQQMNVIANGDEKFISSMVAMFRNIASDTIVKMNEAVAVNDIETIKKLAHKIKPSLDNLEIHILYNEIRALENYNYVTGCPDNLKKMVHFVTQTLSKVIEQLSNYKQMAS
jgi:PAS domain S-box-containing protein